MADQVLQLNLTAEDAASPEIKKLEAALSTLGISTERIVDGMSESERRMVGAFGTIADSAQVSGDTIEQALVKTLAQIDSPAAITELERELQRLAQSGKLAGADLEKLADWQRDLNARSLQAADAQAKVTRELRQYGTAAKQAAADADDLADATGKTAVAFKDHREAAEKSAGANSGLSDTFGDLSGELAGALAIGVVAQRFLEANQAAEALNKQFRAMTGDADSAQQEIAFLTDVANRWGVSVNDLAPAYLRLAAATKGTTAEGAATRKMIDDLSAAFINAGSGADDIEEAMELIGEAFADGRVSIDDLKQGMQEDLPPALQTATTAVLENNAALQEMLASGDAATEEFMPAFAAALREHIGGSSTEVDSLQSAFARMQATIDRGLVAIGDRIPIIDALSGTLNATAKSIETVFAGATILIDGFKGVGNIAGAAAGALANGGDVMDAVAEQARATGDSIEATVLHLFGLKTAAEEAAERDEQLRQSLQAAREETDPFGAALEKTKKNLKDAASEFENTGDVVKLTQTALEEFIKAPEKQITPTGIYSIAAALQAVGTQAQGAGDKVSETLGAELSKLTNEQLAELEQQARKAMAEASNNEQARKAFAELGQIIEGVVLARLQRLGVDGPEALSGISTAATDAIADFDALANNADLSANTIEKAFEGALTKLDNPQELEVFKQKILALGDEGKLSLEQVERMLLLIRQRAQEVSIDPAFAALAKQLAEVREETERGIAQSDRQAEVSGVQIQAAIELAKAKGDEAEAARLTAEATQFEVERAQERIAQMRDQQVLIDGQIQKLYAQANADGVYTEEERKAVEALKDKSAELGKNTALLESRLPKLEREAQQAAVMAGPIGQLTRLYAEQTKEHEQAAAASDQYYDTQLKEAQGAIQVAKARGDEAEAARLVAQEQDILIAQAKAKAAVSAQSAADAQNAVDAYTLQAQATAGINAAEKEQIAQLQAVADAKQAAAQQSVDYAETLRAETAATREKAEEDRKAAEAAQRAKQAEEDRKIASEGATTVMNRAREAVAGLGGDTEKLTARLNQLQASFANAAMTSIADWMGRTAGAVRQVTQEYESQQGRLDALTETLQHFADTGEYTSTVQRAMAAASGNAADQFTLLGQEDLSNLRSALDSANQKLRDMQQATEDARTRLSELNAELLEAQGQDKKAELLRQQLDYETRLAEIEKQRQEAELLGNRELVAILTQQEQVLRQINAAKVESIQSDDKTEQAGDKVANSWNRAEAAIRSTGAALGEVHNLGQRVAEIDLSGLNTQMTGLASQADKLRSVL